MSDESFTLPLDLKENKLFIALKAGAYAIVVFSIAAIIYEVNIVRADPEWGGLMGWLLIILVIALIAMLMKRGHQMLIFFSTTKVLETDRVKQLRIKPGTFERDLYLESIGEVSLSQNPLQKLLDVATITLWPEGRSDRWKFKIPNISEPHQFHDFLKDLIDQNRSQQHAELPTSGWSQLTAWPNRDVQPEVSQTQLETGQDSSSASNKPSPFGGGRSSDAGSIQDLTTIFPETE